jgi:hypothetical protein
MKTTENLKPGSSTVITFDEQLYAKARKLKSMRPEQCKSLVLRLGSFHTVLNFLRVIGKYNSDCGLSDIVRVFYLL